MNIYQNQSKLPSVAGFTLVELLVTIAITGVLAAVAIPSFFHQVAKARTSEGKTGIGTINRAQLAYRLQFNSFTTDIDDLETRISSRFYEYSLNDGGASFVSVVATTTVDDLNGYSGAVAAERQDGRALMNSIICESNRLVSAGNGAPIPDAVFDLACPSNTFEVK